MLQFAVLLVLLGSVTAEKELRQTHLVFPQYDIVNQRCHEQIYDATAGQVPFACIQHRIREVYIAAEDIISLVSETTQKINAISRSGGRMGQDERNDAKKGREAVQEEAKQLREEAEKLKEKAQKLKDRAKQSRESGNSEEADRLEEEAKKSSSDWGKWKLKLGKLNLKMGKPAKLSGGAKAAARMQKAGDLKKQMGVNSDDVEWKPKPPSRRASGSITGLLVLAQSDSNSSASFLEQQQPELQPPLEVGGGLDLVEAQLEAAFFESFVELDAAVGKPVSMNLILQMMAGLKSQLVTAEGKIKALSKRGQVSHSG